MFKKNLFAFIFISSFLNFFDVVKGNDFVKQVVIENKNEIGIDYFQINKSEDYILGAGDQLMILISRDLEEDSEIARIDRSGKLNLKKLKKIYVEGLTISELTQLLNKAYSEFVKFPDVEISVVYYRNINVLVKGEVEDPGLQYLEGSIQFQELFNAENGSIRLQRINENNLTNNNRLKNPNFRKTSLVNRGSFYPTIFDAIRSAKGITRYSDLSKVKVVRINSISNGGGKKETTVDFSNALLDGNLNQNLRVFDGDVIIVPKLKEPNTKNFKMALGSGLNDKFIDVFVAGRVNAPGQIKTSRVGALNDAIKLAGGTKVLKGNISFLRLENDGMIDKRKIKYSPKSKRGSYRNPYLKDGDIIFVGENIFTISSEVISELTSPFTGIFSSYGLYKAISGD